MSERSLSFVPTVGGPFLALLLDTADGGPRKGAMRARIVDAAERIIVEAGVAAATTKAVAREAGCAEGTLYVHFADRLAIFSAIFEKRWPMASEALSDLQARAGSGSVVANLACGLQAVRDFLVSLEPLIAGVKSDPVIGRALHDRWCQLDVGPQRLVQELTAYIARERDLGRIAPTTDPETVAETLLGFLFFTLGKAKFSPGASAELSVERLSQVIATNVRPRDE
jgi:AcrR family transcriptional regulator